MTVPSPGISSPASTITTSPRGSSDAPAVVPSCSRRPSPGASPGACRPGPAAPLGERLGHVREHDGQPQPDRDRERVPGGVAAAAERGRPEDLDQPGDGGDHGAELDDEHHRVADLHPRVELDEAVDQSARGRCPAGTARSARRSLRGARVGRLGLWSTVMRPQLTRSRARFSSNTFDPGLAGEAQATADGVGRISACTLDSARCRRRRSGRPGCRRWPPRCAGRRPKPRCRPRRPESWRSSRPGVVAAVRARVRLDVRRRSPLRWRLRWGRGWRTWWPRRCTAEPSRTDGSGSNGDQGR